MENIEHKIIELVAADRIGIPISSMDGKLKRRKPKMAQDIDDDLNGKKYRGERVFAFERNHDELKARGTKEGIERFAEQYPKYGKILKELIDEERAVRERYLVFGMKQGCILAADDYRKVMADLGFSNAMAERLYPELMTISRSLKKKRNEKYRKILIEQDI